MLQVPFCKTTYTKRVWLNFSRRRPRGAGAEVRPTKPEPLGRRGIAESAPERNGAARAATYGPRLGRLPWRMGARSDRRGLRRRSSLAPGAREKAPLHAEAVLGERWPKPPAREVYQKTQSQSETADANARSYRKRPSCFVLRSKSGCTLGGAWRHRLAVDKD